MKVIDKMNELVGTNASKEKIMGWAYQNRVHVICMHLDEPKFEALENSVQRFIDSGQLVDDEHENWGRFLEMEFVEPEELKIIPQPVEQTVSSHDWVEIEKKMNYYRRLYMKSNHFNLFNLEQLQARFDEGERTQELAEDIDSIIGAAKIADVEYEGAKKK